MKSILLYFAKNEKNNVLSDNIYIKFDIIYLNFLMHIFVLICIYLKFKLKNKDNNLIL